MANGWGGKRKGSGRPRKPLADKILDDSGKRKPKVLQFAESESEDLSERLKMPDWGAYYGSKIAGEPSSQQIYECTAEWLRATGCLHLINPDFIMDYAILKATWYESQRLITKFGLVYSTKKNTEGKDVLEASFFIDTSMKYYKMSEVAWDKIWRIVEQNCIRSFDKHDSQNAVMRKLIGLED